MYIVYIYPDTKEMPQGMFSLHIFGSQSARNVFELHKYQHLMNCILSFYYKITHCTFLTLLIPPHILKGDPLP